MIQRDEGTGKPYWWNPNTGQRNGRAQDRETGALKRAREIAGRYGLLIYHQGDPRGCCLYVYAQADLDRYSERMRPAERPATIDCCYSSVGTAVIG